VGQSGLDKTNPCILVTDEDAQPASIYVSENSVRVVNKVESPWTGRDFARDLPKRQGHYSHPISDAATRTVRHDIRSLSTASCN
jgi:hypothetical protein